MIAMCIDIFSACVNPNATSHKWVMKHEYHGHKRLKTIINSYIACNIVNAMFYTFFDANVPDKLNAILQYNY